MKKILLACVLFTSIASSSTAFAQAIPNPTVPVSPDRIISLTGTAEMEIVPDEIYVRVTLREFTKDKKKYSIEELEKTFLNFIETAAATPRANVKMDNTDAQIIAMKRKEKDAVIDKTYEVKFKNNTQVVLLFSAADSLNLSYVNITRYSHSKIEEYKREVRIAAVKNGKEKATYLLAALDQKPGKILSVTEKSPYVRIDDGIDDYRTFRGNTANTYYSEQLSGSYQSPPSTALVKTIKLTFEVEMMFEIIN